MSTFFFFLKPFLVIWLALMGFHIVWLSICFGGGFVFLFFPPLILDEETSCICVTTKTSQGQIWYWVRFSCSVRRHHCGGGTRQAWSSGVACWNTTQRTAVCVCVLERSVLAGCQLLFIASLLFHPSSSMLPHLLAFFICLKRPPPP